MKEYQYIRIVVADQKPKTYVYEVYNKLRGTLLGTIKWYGPWRQYCFLICGNYIFSKGCLNDIADFITHREKYHRELNGGSDEQN